MTDRPPLDWPHRERSRWLHAADVDWHLQCAGLDDEHAGERPFVLLLHGSGGSTHSWHRVLLPLASHARVLALDLPGHGFSRVDRVADAVGAIYTIAGMASAVGGLLRALPEQLPRLSDQPALIAGHSAGFAIAVRMAVARIIAPRALVGVNPAIVAPPAMYRELVAPLIAPLAESALAAESAAWIARHTGTVRTLLASTGSRLAPAEIARYELLCARPSHCHAALSMFSRWDLAALLRDAGHVELPMSLVSGSRDGWVLPDQLRRASGALPRATLEFIDDAGHLLPEERPDAVVETMLHALRR